MRRPIAVALAVLAAALLSACGSPGRSGGYYQNDGPPRQPHGDLAALPDPVPRIEPFHPFANRPYTALGKRYAPNVDDRPLRQRGIASWYGRQFHGNRTASGEIYDMFALSAAHPTMPLPSYARVTHERTGASVIVRVNDRGPFADGRIIDLSYAAATRLGMIGDGTARVLVERITHADIAAASAASLPDAAAAPAAAEQPPDGSATRVVWSVQLGAFVSEENARALHQRALTLLAADAHVVPEIRSLRIERDGAFFRVLLGAVSERDRADVLAEQVGAVLNSRGIVVPRCQPDC